MTRKYMRASVREPRRNWSPEEDAILAQMLARRAPVSEIARALARSVEAVTARRHYRNIWPSRARRGIERPCLCCKTKFVSQGPHNRLCGACRRADPPGPFDLSHQVLR